MSRETLLDRVRTAAAAGRAHRVQVKPVPPSAGYVGGGPDLCQTLATEIGIIGGEASIVDSWQAAAELLRQLLKENRMTTAVCWQHDALERLDLLTLLKKDGVTANGFDQLSILSHDERRRLILAADAGITSVDFAIAETGSLAVFARPGQERSFSLVPPIHIAIVAEHQILPDLFDLFAHFSAKSQSALPSNVALISGPSKTGDIELELTTGVHGPGKWIVVIVRES